MADYRSSGAHQLNKWLWSKLKDFKYDGTNYAFADYRGSTPTYPVVPIIPAQQQPEFVDMVGGSPFIVYNFRENPKAAFWLTKETCAYVIYDSDEERLRAIRGYIVDLLKRYDWTARDINSYMASNSISGFDFKWIAVFTSVGTEPSMSEGGRSSAHVAANYEYTVDIDGHEGSGLRV